VDAAGTPWSAVCNGCPNTATVARYSYALNQRLTTIFWLTDPVTGGPVGWCNFGALACTEGTRNATLGEIGAPANTIMLSEEFDAPMNGMATWGSDASWMGAQDRFNGNTIVSLMDGHVKTVRGSTTMYTQYVAGVMDQCKGWWFNDLRDIQGSPVAVCAANRPEANIWFGPRQGR
jgi:hypothetical protein